MKRFLSILMATMFFISVFSAVDLSAYAAEISDAISKAEPASLNDEDDFDNRLLDMLSQYKVENGYSKIIFDADANTVQKDGEEAVHLDDYDIDYDKIDTPQDLMKACPVFKNMGMLYSGNSQDSKEVAPQVDYEDGKVIFTNAYQSKRLIVQTANNKLSNNYGAVQSIHNGNGYHVLQFDTQADAKAAKEKLEKNKNVEYVVCDEVVKTNAISERDGAKLIQSDRYIEYLNKNNKKTSVTVAVLDTGVDTTHSDLKNRLLTGYNAYTKKTNVKDGHGHGTHVAGIVADNTPSTVKILPVKVLNDDGTGTDLAIKAGIDYAVKKKVKVINLSLGGNCTSASCPIKKGIDAAIKAGVTVVAAAGNDTCDTKNACPAYIGSCITVASCYYDANSVSNFSNYGSAVDVTAPGEDILSCAPGNSYQYMSGTSMAAPFASAAAALLIMNNPALKPADVEKNMKSTCADMMLKGHDKYSGAGVLNFGILLGDKYTADSISTTDNTLTFEYFSKATPMAAWATIYNSEDAEGRLPLTDRSFTSSSSNPSVAVFDGRYIVAKGSGSCTITLALPNGAKDTLKVKATKKEVWIDYASSGYAGGKGTKSSPYQIKTAAQLAKFAKDVRTGKTFKGKYFKLMNDVDLKGKMWISASCIKKESDYSNSWTYLDDFQGNFDGGNHKIKNMTVFDLKPTASWGENNTVNGWWYKENSGFIGNCSNATIKNLGIENGYNVNKGGGLLVDDVYQGTKISNCYTSGFTVGDGLAGGVLNYGIEISNCYSSATVLGSGLIGHLYSSKQTGDVKIRNSFFCGELLSSDGNSTPGNFTSNIYAKKGYDHMKVTNCFSAAVSPDDLGFANLEEYASISNCYYRNTNQYGIKSKKKGSVHIKAKSASFFKKKSNYTNTKTWNSKYKWDFKNTWAINSSVNNGYPYLKKNKPNKVTQKKTGTWVDYAASKFASGKGTKSSPYVIETAPQLARLAKIYRFGGGENKYFKITKNIDLSAHTWHPIGAGHNMNYAEDGNDSIYRYYKMRFMGNIDGTSKTITGLKVPSTGEYSGFVTKLSKGTIKNLNFKNADVSGSDYVGIVSGINSQSANIVNCSVSGKVSGKNYVGTITGINNSPSNIFGCKSSATVSGSEYGGGITASNYGFIERTSFSGSFGAQCEGAYAICHDNDGVIKNCYSTSFSKYLTQTNKSGEIVNSYLAGESCLLYNYSLHNRDIKTVKVEDLKKKSTFTNWDFEKIWSMDSKTNKGYPTLKKANFSEIKYPKEKWKAAKTFAGGKGKKSDPYLISNASQLAILRDRSDEYDGKYFRIIRNINLDGKIWDDNDYFTLPVIKIHIDGNNKTVSNMTNKNSTGLFPIASQGTIKNLNVKNVKGTSACGIISTNMGNVTNCTVTGTLRSNSDVGGICQENFGTVEKCSVQATLVGSSNVGGIVGYNCGPVKNCYTSGRCQGYNTGAIVANNHLYSGGSVTNSYSVMTNISAEEVASESGFTNVYLLGWEKDNCTSAMLKKKDTYKGFDFSRVWTISSNKNNGYPTLRGVTSRKISYVLNGGKATSAMEYSYVPGVERTLKKPTRKNYVFVGWYKEKSCKTKVTKIGSKDVGDVKYYAKWKKK